MLRVAILADIGQPVYHVGDEAMGHAAAVELTNRGLQPVMLSRNPAQSQQLFNTEAAATLNFPWPPLERERYLDEIARALAGERDALPPGDQVWELFSVIAGCDAVLIAGGGNMNSIYGWLLYERAALGLIAAHYNKPLVISGQTLGPALTAADSRVLTTLLASAQLVGVRESASEQLAHKLGIPGGQVIAGQDDAAFYAVANADPQARRSPYVAVTFSPGTGELPAEEFFGHVAAVLDELAAVSGLAVVFVPHMADPAAQDQDLMAHQRIAAAMKSPNVELRELQSAAEAAALTAGASMVVSSRYHPAVFAAGAGVPVVSLSTDHYSDVRLSGALRNWGLAAFNVPAAALLNGDFELAVLTAWEQREAIARHLKSLSQRREDEARLWWDAVVLGLQGQVSPPPPGLAPAEPYPGATIWHAGSEAVRRTSHPLGDRAVVAELELERERGLRQWQVQEAEATLVAFQASKAHRLASTAWRIKHKIKTFRKGKP